MPKMGASNFEGVSLRLLTFTMTVVALLLPRFGEGTTQPERYRCSHFHQESSTITTSSLEAYDCVFSQPVTIQPKNGHSPHSSSFCGPIMIHRSVFRGGLYIVNCTGMVGAFEIVGADITRMVVDSVGFGVTVREGLSSSATFVPQRWLSLQRTVVHHQLTISKIRLVAWANSTGVSDTPGTAGTLARSIVPCGILIEDCKVGESLDIKHIFATVSTHSFEQPAQQLKSDAMSFNNDTAWAQIIVRGTTILRGNVSIGPSPLFGLQPHHYHHDEDRDGVHREQQSSSYQHQHRLGPLMASRRNVPMPLSIYDIVFLSPFGTDEKDEPVGGIGDEVEQQPQFMTKRPSLHVEGCVVHHRIHGDMKVADRDTNSFSLSSLNIQFISGDDVSIRLANNIIRTTVDMDSMHAVAGISGTDVKPPPSTLEVATESVLLVDDATISPNYFAVAAVHLDTLSGISPSRLQELLIEGNDVRVETFTPHGGDAVSIREDEGRIGSPLAQQSRTKFIARVSGVLVSFTSASSGGRLYFHNATNTTIVQGAFHAAISSNQITIHNSICSSIPDRFASPSHGVSGRTLLSAECSSKSMSIFAATQYVAAETRLAAHKWTVAVNRLHILDDRQQPHKRNNPSVEAAATVLVEKATSFHAVRGLELRVISGLTDDFNNANRNASVLPALSQLHLTSNTVIIGLNGTSSQSSSTGVTFSSIKAVGVLLDRANTTSSPPLNNSAVLLGDGVLVGVCNTTLTLEGTTEDPLLLAAAESASSSARKSPQFIGASIHVGSGAPLATNSTPPSTFSSATNATLSVSLLQANSLFQQGLLLHLAEDASIGAAVGVSYLQLNTTNSHAAIAVRVLSPLSTLQMTSVGLLGAAVLGDRQASTVELCGNGCTAVMDRIWGVKNTNSAQWDVVGRAAFPWGGDHDDGTLSSSYVALPYPIRLFLLSQRTTRLSSWSFNSSTFVYSSERWVNPSSRSDGQRSTMQLSTYEKNMAATGGNGFTEAAFAMLSSGANTSGIVATALQAAEMVSLVRALDGPLLSAACSGVNSSSPTLDQEQNLVLREYPGRVDLTEITNSDGVFSPSQDQHREQEQAALLWNWIVDHGLHVKWPRSMSQSLSPTQTLSEAPTRTKTLSESPPTRSATPTPTQTLSASENASASETFHLSTTTTQTVSIPLLETETNPLSNTVTHETNSISASMEVLWPTVSIDSPLLNESLRGLTLRDEGLRVTMESHVAVFNCSAITLNTLLRHVLRFERLRYTRVILGVETETDADRQVTISDVLAVHKATSTRDHDASARATTWEVDSAAEDDLQCEAQRLSFHIPPSAPRIGRNVPPWRVTFIKWGAVLLSNNVSDMDHLLMTNESLDLKLGEDPHTYNESETLSVSEFVLPPRGLDFTLLELGGAVAFGVGYFATLLGRNQHLFSAQRLLALGLAFDCADVHRSSREEQPLHWLRNPFQVSIGDPGTRDRYHAGAILCALLFFGGFSCFWIFGLIAYKLATNVSGSAAQEALGVPGFIYDASVVPFFTLTASSATTIVCFGLDLSTEDGQGSHPAGTVGTGFALSLVVLSSYVFLLGVLFALVNRFLKATTVLRKDVVIKPQRRPEASRIKNNSVAADFMRGKFVWVNKNSSSKTNSRGSSRPINKYPATFVGSYGRFFTPFRLQMKWFESFELLCCLLVGVGLAFADVGVFTKVCSGGISAIFVALLLRSLVVIFFQPMLCDCDKLSTTLSAVVEIVAGCIAMAATFGNTDDRSDSGMPTPQQAVDSIGAICFVVAIMALFSSVCSLIRRDVQEWCDEPVPTLSGDKIPDDEENDEMMMAGDVTPPEKTKDFVIDYVNSMATPLLEVPPHDHHPDRPLQSEGGGSPSPFLPPPTSERSGSTMSFKVHSPPAAARSGETPPPPPPQHRIIANKFHLHQWEEDAHYKDREVRRRRERRRRLPWYDDGKDGHGYDEADDDDSTVADPFDFSDDDGEELLKHQGRQGEDDEFLFDDDQQQDPYFTNRHSPMYRQYRYPRYKVPTNPQPVDVEGMVGFLKQVHRRH